MKTPVSCETSTTSPRGPTRPQQMPSDQNSPTSEGLALPEQLSDSGKRSANTGPTL